MTGAAEVRAHFEALLAGIEAVAEGDSDRAEQLLGDLARAISEQAEPIKRALLGQPEPQWSAPQQLFKPNGDPNGTLRIKFCPEATR